MPRSVWLRREDERVEAENDSTICLPALRLPNPGVGPLPRASFEQLTLRHYALLRTLLNAHREPGLALIVAGPEGVEASAWVNVEVKGINPLIVGRHSSAEIFLPADPSLSLRHLAVIVERREPGAVRFRVLDLRTAAAFEDEQGRRLEGLESAGPTPLHCASYALLLFPTGAADEPWPEDPADGWARVPARVFIDVRTADPELWVGPAVRIEAEEAPPLASNRASDTTTCVSFPGPVFPALLRPRAVDESPAIGELRLASRSGRATLRLGREAARQGVLLGRYERCDAAGLPLLANDRLSRVHLLIVEIGGALYAIDTASRNGTRLAGESIRSARLEPGRPLALARDVSVEWQPFH